MQTFTNTKLTFYELNTNIYERGIITHEIDTDICERNILTFTNSIRIYERNTNIYEITNANTLHESLFQSPRLGRSFAIRQSGTYSQ